MATREYHQKYYFKNKERILKHARIYNSLNKERQAHQKKQYRERNKEYFKLKKHEYYLRTRKLHPLPIYGRKEVCRRYYQKNKEGMQFLGVNSFTGFMTWLWQQLITDDYVNNRIRYRIKKRADRVLANVNSFVPRPNNR